MLVAFLAVAFAAAFYLGEILENRGFHVFNGIIASVVVR